jgi:4-hydroxybenzoate polyprenyltransferase
MSIKITRSAWLHLRIAFSFFLMPVFVFALSQAPRVDLINAFLVFIIWHLFVYPASNGYNSYFDKDEGSIALLEKPPAVDRSLYFLSLFLDLIGFLLSLLISLEFAAAVLIYGLLSKLYSHPSIRLKKYPIISFLVVFIFQGAFIYWTSFSAISNSSVFADWNVRYLVAGLICSCLIGASYPLTQVYQHEEDSRRGDRTLSLMLGVKGSFIFSAILFTIGTILVWIYWNGNERYFYLYLLFIIPVLIKFFALAKSAWKDYRKASFKPVMALTTISGGMMLLYFLTILLLKIDS